MNFIETKNKIFSIRPNDPYWLISDGMIITPRAGFEISERCPGNHKVFISNAIDQGWLTAVAYITEREKVFLGLSNE